MQYRPERLPMTVASCHVDLRDRHQRDFFPSLSTSHLSSSSFAILLRLATISACERQVFCCKYAISSEAVLRCKSPLRSSSIVRRPFLINAPFTGVPSSESSPKAASNSFAFTRSNFQACYTAPPLRPSGEIGRRTVFRSQHRKVCWFESSLGHHFPEIPRSLILGIFLSLRSVSR